MKQTLDDGRVLFFGQQLTEVEALFGSVAIDDPIRIARKGIDKLLKTDGLTLRFDTDRLKDIQFRPPYQFINPLTPYPEQWKNFDKIGAMGLRSRLSREEFLSYLQEWEKRATSLGAEKMPFGDLSERQYSISIDRDEFFDAIHVSIGPSRRAGGRGIWCDGWGISFTKTNQHSSSGKIEAELLESISAFRDEFNTVARPKDPRRN